MKILRVAAGALVLCVSFAQLGIRAQVSYDDVGIIVNTNSTISRTIADYFVTARSIPRLNIIPVTVPEYEEIDSVAFEALRLQVEAYLQSHSLTTTINYLVTTKGLPLKVNRGSTFSPTSASSSVESELALLLGPYSQSIGQAGHMSSPFYNQADHFSRARYGIYLVTRLDGYTLEDVENLIDRGGPNTTVNAGALYLLDQDPSSVVIYLNTYMGRARDILIARSKNVRLNTDSVYVTGQTDVVAYVSWGSNDRYADLFTDHAIPHNTWARGAIAETYVSTSARSFSFPPAYGQSLIADLVAEGVSGAKGYVYEPYASAMANASILLDRYTSGYNLAESYYMASMYLSWMDVIVGDPKTSISQEEPPQTPSIVLSSFHASPFKQSKKVLVTWETSSEHNNAGFAVQRRDVRSGEFVDVTDSLIQGAGTTNEPNRYSWTDRFAPSGTCYYRLRHVDLDGKGFFTDSIEVFVGKNRESVEQVRHIQNYPNPFNPSTSISFELLVDAKVTLTVYNSVGQEVSALVDGEKSAGMYSIKLDGSHLASGVYFYRLQVGDFVTTKSTVLLK